MITFAIIQLAPGGPAILLDDRLTQDDRDQIRRNLGLDRPIPVQYFLWSRALIQGDLGNSYLQREPVMTVITRRFPNTVLLAGVSLALAIIVGIPLGILAATRANSLSDYVSTLFSVVGISVPPFWLGILMIILFSVNLGLLPSAGMYTLGGARTPLDLAAHLVMPALVMALAPLATVVRYTRSSMLGVIRLEYVRTARAKGLSNRVVLYRHALRNALVPIVTVIGLQLPQFLGGSVIVERIFAWPGMGRLAADAAFGRDYPVVMGVTVVVTLIVVAANLLTDLLYGFLNPRIRWA
jgi:peptide/nickel transport system permease protein